VAFERKKTPNENPNTTFWNILQWYWVLIPTFYFLFVVPNMVEGVEGAALELGDVYNIFFQLLNLAFAGILIQTPPLERSRTGVADRVLKIAAVQQFLIQNIFGLILALFVWYKLPYRMKPEMVSAEEAEKWYFQPKTLFILTITVLVLTILAIISQFALI